MESRPRPGGGLLALAFVGLGALSCLGCDHIESKYLVVGGAVPAPTGSELEVLWHLDTSAKDGVPIAGGGFDGAPVSASLIPELKKTAASGSADWLGRWEHAHPEPGDWRARKGRGRAVQGGPDVGIQVCFVRSRAVGNWEEERTSGASFVSPDGLQFRWPDGVMLCVVPVGELEGSVWRIESEGGAEERRRGEKVGTVRRVSHTRQGDEWWIELDR